MKVRTGRVASAFILRLDGRLTVQADLRELDQTIKLTSSRVRSVVLDLGGVDQLDCSGIGWLVRLHNQVVASGRMLILANVRPRMKWLLEVAGLLAVFPVCESPREAVFWQPRARQRIAVRAGTRHSAGLRSIPSVESHAAGRVCGRAR